MAGAHNEMKSPSPIVFVIVLTLVNLAGEFAGGQERDYRHQPAVISVSWSSPDPRFLSLNYEKWNRLPFTGTAINVAWPRPEGGSVLMASATENPSWAVFRSKPVPEEALHTARADMAKVPDADQRDNYLWVVSSLNEERYFDWFDDQRWTAVEQNIERMAAMARETKMKGIVLDCEEYGCALWSWGGSRPDFALSQAPPYQGKTWNQVRAQVMKRGESFMKALDRGYPGATLWMLYAYSHTIYKYPQELQNLAEQDNGLLVTFVDGMLKGADEKTVIVDGCEPSYYRTRTLEDFERLADVIRNKALRYTSVPEIYKRKIRVGFGIYLDMYHGQPWNGQAPEQNAMTPDILQELVGNALKAGDGYVWVYSEYPSWWLDSAEATFGGDVKARDDHKWIPPVYYDALKRGIQAGKDPS